jgi:hypothetical protein
MTHEGRIYTALTTHGGWARLKDVCVLMNNMPSSSVSHALSRLKLKGAVSKNGEKHMAVWRALPGFDITDRRQFNGAHFALPPKPKVIRVVAPPKASAPVLASPLSQALAWLPNSN